MIACALVMSGAGAVYAESQTESAVVSEVSPSETESGGEVTPGTEETEAEVTPTPTPEAAPTPEAEAEPETTPSPTSAPEAAPAEAAPQTESGTENPPETSPEQQHTAEQDPQNAGEDGENPDSTPGQPETETPKAASSFTLTIDYKSADNTEALIPEPEPLIYVYLEEKSEAEDREHHFAPAAFNTNKSTALIPAIGAGEYNLTLYTADDKAAADAACTDQAIPNTSIFKAVGEAGQIGAFTLQSLPDSQTIKETATSLDLHAMAGDATFNAGGIKKISGITKTDKVFTFELYRADDKYAVKEKLYEAKTSGTITSADGLPFTFGSIAFTKAGTYYYVVKEKADDAKEGFTYDTAEYHLSVKAEEQGGSVCVKEIAVAKGTAAAATVKFSAVAGPKFRIDGIKPADYELYGYTTKKEDLIDAATGLLKDGAKKAETDTPSTGDTHLQAKFPASGEGVYFALVKTGSKVPEAVIEVTPGKDGAPARWNLSGSGCEFLNTYKAASVTETVGVKKVVKGNPEKTETFTFLMKRTSGKKVSEVTIKGSGEATFPKSLKFSKTGTYTYVVTETAGSTKNMKYDSSSYKVVFKVTDNGKGSLVAKRTITKGSKSASKVTFTNTYTEPKVDPVVTGDFSITKVDEFDKEGVEGSVYTIYGAKGTKGSSARTAAEKNLKRGKIVDSQIKKLTSESTGDDGIVTFTGLESGTYYVIRETTAPNGYQKSANPIIISTKAKDGVFSANVIDSGEGTVTKSKSGEVIWTEHPTRVTIYMKSSSGALLTNAKLELVDKSTGKVVETWKSGKTSHEVRYLTAGHQYTIRQTNKLSGYEQAKPVTFTVTKEGVVTNDVIQSVTITSKKLTSSSSKSSSSTRRTNGSAGSRGNTTTGNRTRTQSARTGDYAPIATLIALMAAALVAVVLVLRRKKR